MDNHTGFGRSVGRRIDFPLLPCLTALPQVHGIHLHLRRADLSAEYSFAVQGQFLPSAYLPAVHNHAAGITGILLAAARDGLDSFRGFYNVGAQLNTEVVLFKYLKTTWSIGYARVFGPDGLNRGDWLISLKLL